MLTSVPNTIPCEDRDFHEWRRGRETYAVWVLALDNAVIQQRFNAAREYLDGFLLQPYRRQPHITLFVCGFLVETPQHDDDFTQSQFQSQMRTLETANMRAFEIEIGGLNSFASAPFLEVRDPQGGVARLRELLSTGAREFRTAPYLPHLTVGLYAGAFPGEKVAERMSRFPSDSIKMKVGQIAFATYQAREIAGALTLQQEVMLAGAALRKEK